MGAPDDSPPLPLEATVLGAFAGVRRGVEEWRPYSAWDPAERADDLLVPSVEVWVRATPDVKAWLAAADDAPDVRLSVTDSLRADVDHAALTFSARDVGDLDVEVPAALLDVCARAAMLTGDPAVLTVTATGLELPPEWWARTPTHEPDLTFVTDARPLRRAVMGHVGRGLESAGDDEP